MTIRPLQPSDAREIERLVSKWTDRWEIPDNTTAARLHEWLTGPTVESSEDSRSHWAGSELIGLTVVALPPSDARQTVALISGLVDPDHRGHGLGTDLLGWSLDRARHRLLGSGSAFPLFIRAWVWEWLTDTRELLERHGLHAVRRFDVMEKRLGGTEPVNLSDQISIVPWDQRRNDEARLINNRAFADHWGAIPISRVNWKHLMGGEQIRPDLSRMAIAADGAIVGYALSAIFPQADDGRREAWVRILGVSPSWRRRGIGAALMTSCHNSFIEEGCTHSILRVDAASPTGANDLYEQIGYTVTRSSLTYETEIEKNDSSLTAS